MNQEEFLPSTSKELFSNGTESYYFHTDEEMDNNESMKAFLNMVGITDEEITLYDGTQVYLSNGTIHLQLDSSGMGDMYSHLIEVSVIPQAIHESKNSKIKSMIREIIDEVIEEMTTSGAAGAYLTPNAFRGHHSKKKEAERSMPGGKVVGKDDETDDTTVGENLIPIVRRELEEGRSRYRNFKESDVMRNHAKVSYGIREAKKILREVDFLVGICERLKTESGVEPTQYWKRTAQDLVGINSQLKEISKRIKRIGK
jgi:hypothetical protein